MKRFIVVMGDERWGLCHSLPEEDPLQPQLLDVALKDTLELCQALEVPGYAPPTLVLAYNGERDWYQQRTPLFWLLVPQVGFNRTQALDNLLIALGPDPDDQTVFLGLRTPHLSPADLQTAFATLRHRQTCVGLSPEGGVYALGVRGRWPTGLLQTVPWETPAAPRELQRLIRRGGMGVSMLPERAVLAREEHLRTLAAELPACDYRAMPHMRQLLRKLEMLDD